jgi:hypothetical protein
MCDRVITAAQTGDVDFIIGTLREALADKSSSLTPADKTATVEVIRANRRGAGGGAAAVENASA